MAIFIIIETFIGKWIRINFGLESVIFNTLKLKKYSADMRKMRIVDKNHSIY